MTQSPRDEALSALDPLVGEWTMEAIPPGGQGSPPGEATCVYEWHDSGAHLVQRVSIEMPEAPNSITVIGCDGANGNFLQLYSDDRGVSRIYEMTIDESELTLRREGDPFPQRFVGRFEDGGDTISGYWEKALDGGEFEKDFDLVYRRVK